MGDIARQISAGLRCDSKKLKALQKSHRVTHKSARMTPPFGKRVPLTASPRNNFYFRHACARFSEVLILAPQSFLLWQRVRAHRRAPRSTAGRRAPPTRERCLLAVTPDGSGTPIIMQGPPNGGRGPRNIRRSARSAAHDPARQQQASAAGFLAERAVRESSNPPCRYGNHRRSTASVTASPFAWTRLR